MQEKIIQIIPYFHDITYETRACVYNIYFNRKILKQELHHLFQRFNNIDKKQKL